MKIKEIRIYDNFQFNKTKRIGPFSTKPEDILESLSFAVHNSNIYVMFIYASDFSIHSISAELNPLPVIEQILDLKSLLPYTDDVDDFKQFKPLILEHFSIGGNITDDIWELFVNEITSYSVAEDRITMNYTHELESLSNSMPLFMKELILADDYKNWSDATYNKISGWLLQEGIDEDDVSNNIYPFMEHIYDTTTRLEIEKGLDVESKELHDNNLSLIIDTLSDETSNKLYNNTLDFHAKSEILNKAKLFYGNKFSLDTENVDTFVENIIIKGDYTTFYGQLRDIAIEKEVFVNESLIVIQSHNYDDSISLNEIDVNELVEVVENYDYSDSSYIITIDKLTGKTKLYTADIDEIKEYNTFYESDLMNVDLYEFLEGSEYVETYPEIFGDYSLPM